MIVGARFIYTPRLARGGFYRHGYNKLLGMSLLAKRLAASAVIYHGRL